MGNTQPKTDQYLLAADVARRLHVSPKTVARWAQEGKLPHVRTLGGHRRYEPGAIDELVRRLAADGVTAEQVAYVA
jgi:excisionase family DNA binding protein